jgi:hypothetical protein
MTIRITIESLAVPRDAGFAPEDLREALANAIRGRFIETPLDGVRPACIERIQAPAPERTRDWPRTAAEALWKGVRQP